MLHQCPVPLILTIKLIMEEQMMLCFVKYICMHMTAYIKMMVSLRNMKEHLVHLSEGYLPLILGYIVHQMTTIR